MPQDPQFPAPSFTMIISFFAIWRAPFWQRPFPEQGVERHIDLHSCRCPSYRIYRHHYFYSPLILLSQPQQHYLIYIFLQGAVISMEANYVEKELKITYEDFQARGKTIDGLAIDHYVVYNQIGEGSNGQVYRGMDDKTKKPVAIKLMDLRSIKNQQNILIKEIKQRLTQSQPRLMYQCESPNLIKCFEVYRNDDLKIMIIQFCNGKTLQAEIDQKRRIPEKQAVQIAKHIINGLMELHRHKIIHRDLKAENIMSHNGTYKIIDFGFSKKLQIAQQNQSIKGTSLGTITTMAPQVMSRKAYGLKADIWSLGIIFFQMIYGVYPYDSLTARALYQEIRTRKLFQNPNPPTINGCTPSKQAYELIKFLIVFQIDERPNWKQVSEYPLIQNDSVQVNQRFIEKVEVKVDQRLAKQSDKIINSQTIVDQQKPKWEEPKPKITEPQNSFQKKQNITQPKKSKINLQQNIRFEQQKRKLQQEQQKKKQLLNELKQKQQQKGLVGVSNVRQLRKDELINKKKEQNNEQFQQYEFTQRAHLQCLKTQLIFNEIIKPILGNQKINRQDRGIIEFIYLLLARCFNNMSPIKYQLESRHKNKNMIKNLEQQIKPLYNNIQSHFLQYSQLLTKTESKITSIIGDFFKKNISKASFSEKDNYLTGIQVINYSKKDQILFTHKFYNQFIFNKISAIANLAAPLKRLNKYIQINNVSKEMLEGTKKTFEVTVREILA